MRSALARRFAMFTGGLLLSTMATQVHGSTSRSAPTNVLPLLQATASDALTTPLTRGNTRIAQAISLNVELRQLSAEPAAVTLTSRSRAVNQARGGSLAGSTPQRSVLLSNRSLTVYDGRSVRVAAAVGVGSGNRTFELDVTARHHPANRVELEWSLEVYDTTRNHGVKTNPARRTTRQPQAQRGLSVTAPRSPARSLRASRADIVTVASQPMRREVWVDGQRYELSLTARPTR